MKVFHENSPNGFALIAAILALMILMAVGILVFTVTNQDIRVSSRVVGEKRAFLTAEAGIHELVKNFDPNNPSQSKGSWQAIDAERDPSSQFKIDSLEAPKPEKGPAAIPLPGYNLNAGDNYGLKRYLGTVLGKDASRNSQVEIEVGMGYGPVDISTLYKQ
jgi:hypothetical protein